MDYIDGQCRNVSCHQGWMETSHTRGERWTGTGLSNLNAIDDKDAYNIVEKVACCTSVSVSIKEEIRR
jgi:hypothetical protein